MVLGYNTNGFAFHALEDAMVVMAELGYRSVALTLDHHHLNPFGKNLEQELYGIAGVLAGNGLACTIETGARFLLDPRQKHQPTLVSRLEEARQRRIGFLCRAIEIADKLEADSVSVWSGAADDQADDDQCLERLAEGLSTVMEFAEGHGVRIGFEPEPGMLIETMAQFEKVYDRVDHPLFGLTLDVGHLVCMKDGQLLDRLRQWSHVMWNVHLEDMKPGRHEHLFFGEGQINFCEVIDFLTAVEYSGPVHVELSGHSSTAVETARSAREFLKALGL